MGFMDKLRSWWGKDRQELAEEEARMTPHERDVAEEDYEARKDDLAIERGGEFTGGATAGGVHFERDSERPSDPTRPE